MQITVNKDDQDLGPYSKEELQSEIASGNISMEDYAWFEGCEDWVTVADVPEIGNSANNGSAETGIYLEQNGEQLGPFPIQQLQRMLNQGQCSIEDSAWMDSWEDWQTLADIPGLKAPRVKVTGSPAINPARGGSSSTAKKSKKKEPTVDLTNEGTQKKRGRKKKPKKKQSRLMAVLAPVLMVLVLVVLGLVGIRAWKMFEGGETIEEVIKNPVAKEEKPPTDPWELVEWRRKRQR